MSDREGNSLPRVGSPAPDFTLPSTSGADVTLSRLRGKNVLLAFFPLAFTKVYPGDVLVDGKEHISVDMLSDFKREVSRKYGTLIENTFFSNRAYVLIGPDGTVRWAYAEDSPSSRRENRELLAQLEKYQRSA